MTTGPTRNADPVMSGHDSHRRRRHPRAQRAEALDHGQAAVLLRRRRRARLGHLRARGAGRRRRGRRLLDGVPGRRGDRRRHRSGVRRARHEVPAGRRCIAVREQGVPQSDPHVLHHDLHAVGQHGRRRITGVRLRPLLQRPGRVARGRDLGGDRHRARLRRDHHDRQPDRHHRIGRGECRHDLHRGHRPGDRDHHRRHRPGRGRGRPGRAAPVQRRRRGRISRSSRSWRVSRSPSSP